MDILIADPRYPPSIRKLVGNDQFPVVPEPLPLGARQASSDNWEGGEDARVGNSGRRKAIGSVGRLWKRVSKYPKRYRF